MDAFFGNGTGWGAEAPLSHDGPSHSVSPAASVPCTWSAAVPNSYLKGCADDASGVPHAGPMSPTGGAVPDCPSFSTLAAAKEACESDLYPACTGVTTRSTGRVELRAGPAPIHVAPSFNETSYVLENPAQCKNTTLPPDPVWLARGKAAYGAVARADGPSARWIYQGAVFTRHSSPCTVCVVHEIFVSFRK